MEYSGPSVVPILTDTGKQQEVPGVTHRLFLKWCRFAGKKLYKERAKVGWPKWQNLSAKEQDYYSGLGQIAIEEQEPPVRRPGWLKAADLAIADLIQNPDGKPMSYKKGDYKKYHASERMKTERAARNKNRRQFEAKGLVRKGDGKEIDHKDGNPKHQKGNLRVISRHANRVKQ